MRRWFAVAVTLLSAIAAGAQESRFGISVEVSLVNVDVVVTDRAGNHVRGLTAADFEIYEDGKLQPITNFAEYRGSGAARVVNAGVSRTVAAEAPPPQKRTVLVFVDRFEVHGRERKELLEGLRKFLRRTVRKGDAVAISSWSSGPQSMNDFTDDLGRLDSTINGLLADRPRIKGSEWDYIDFERTQLEWYYANSSRGPGTNNGADAADRVGTTASQYDATARVVLEVRQKARAMTSLIEAVGAAEGQKILVMLTNRFAPDSGREYTGLSNDVSVSAATQIDAMLRAAKANGVRVYPLYSKIGDMDINETASNRAPQTFQSAIRHTSLRQIETSSLMNIAEQTGGVAGTGLGDLERLFGHIAEDLESYYSLAYRGTGREGREKQLEVKVKSGSYRVRTRRGVVERSGETVLRQRILSALLQPAHTSGIPVHVFMKKARSESGLLQLPLEIRFPVGALTLLPQGDRHAGGFAVYVAWAGAHGTSSDITRKAQPLSVEASRLAAMKSENITFEIEVAATRAVERFVVAVVDEVTQEVGLVRFDMPRPKGR